MNIRVETNQYEFAHGKKPRGYGCWFFMIDGKHEYSITAMYGDAKRKAQKQARCFVSVMS